MSKSYDLSASSKWSALADGEHTIQIVAKGSGYRDSAKSTSVTVTKGGATLISFTIDGTSYQAEEGMTWAQWVNSSYNTGGFYIADGNLFTSEGYNVLVTITNTISNNGEYTINTGGSGDGSN